MNVEFDQETVQDAPRASDYEVLDMANEAGHILLENGAEISRVSKTMEYITMYFGVEDSGIFVLSNGLFTTGTGYARTSFIPIKGANLEKVVAVNQLSHDLYAKGLSVEKMRQRLSEIRSLRPKPLWERLLGAGLGAAFFSIVFGGSITDAAVDFVIGILLFLFVVKVSSAYLSKILGNISNGIVATALCMVSYRLGFGDTLSNMIIGAIITLVPGVPFTNGVRDLANEDYIAGVTRLLDALLVFVSVALGVSVAFWGHGCLSGSMLLLGGMSTDAATSHFLVQFVAAFIGTAAFSILFGVPRKYYFGCGICGLAGWIVYLALARMAGCSPALATLCSTIAVALIANWFAIVRLCPVTVFLVCGIFPLVPGAGIFWTSYYLVSDQYSLILSAGLGAIKITLAIVLGIIIVVNLSGGRIFSLGKLSRSAEK